MALLVQLATPLWVFFPPVVLKVQRLFELLVGHQLGVDAVSDELDLDVLPEQGSAATGQSRELELHLRVGGHHLEYQPDVHDGGRVDPSVAGEARYRQRDSYGGEIGAPPGEMRDILPRDGVDQRFGNRRQQEPASVDESDNT